MVQKAPTDPHIRLRDGPKLTLHVAGRYEYMCNKYAAGNLNGVRAAAKNAAFQDPTIKVSAPHGPNL